MTVFHRRVLAMVSVIVAVLLPPAPARAGGTLVGGDPTDGAALPSAPNSVTLDFTATPEPGLSHVSVRDSNGAEVTSGSPVRDGAHTLRQPIAVLASGDYSVAFHVEFTDGSQLVGARFFSVGTGVPPTASARDREAAAATVSTHEHGVDPLSAIMLVADLGTALTVVVLLLRRPRTRPKRPWRLHEPPPPEGSDPAQ